MISTTLIFTTAAIVFIPAIVAVLAVMVVVVEIRVEALFLLILEEARTLLFLAAEFGSCRSYRITDISVGVVASALRNILSRAFL